MMVIVAVQSDLIWIYHVIVIPHRHLLITHRVKVKVNVKVNVKVKVLASTKQGTPHANDNISS